MRGQRWGWERLYKRGELVFTAAHQGHEVRTGALPLLAAYAWKAATAAPSYHCSSGPWRNGPRTEPDLVNRRCGARWKRRREVK